MRKKLEAILTICLLCCGLLHAAPIDTEEARRKAVQFLAERPGVDGRRMAPARTPRMRLAHQRTTAEGQPAFYVFNNEAGGFVIVSGDDQAESILGFSDSGQFDATDIPDGLADLLKGYEQQISGVGGQSQQRAARRADSQWADIEPLVLTQWNQGMPYNALCPIDPDDGRRCITGCTAVAFAQVMYYHQWPEIGYGRTSYKWNGQTLSADFYNVSFEWDKMKLEYDYEDTDEDQAVATLLYHCSLAAHAAFSSSNTPGSFNRAILTDHFGYKRTAKTLWLDNTSLANFEAIIYNDLKNKLPVLFCADSENSGHAMVVDGYRCGGFFHVNFGWSGGNDGYYKLTAVDDYTKNQYIIYNIEPDRNAPLEAGVYPRESYQLSDDGTTLVKWTGDESYIHLGADAALWGVTEIGDEAFEDCASLEAVFIPNQVTRIGTNIFKGCTNLTSITVDEENKYFHVSNGLLIDNYDYVKASTAQASLIVPETIVTLNPQVFCNSTEIKQITLLKTNNPPYVYDDTFNSDIDYSAVTLYVPQQSIDLYRYDWFWSKFTNIVGISEPVSKKLTVETTTGQKKEYMLYQMPVMKNNGTTLEITTRSGQSVSYDLEKLQKMTFENNNQLGNVNGSGGADIADVAAIVSHLKGKTPQGFDRLAADINQDGQVDGDDVAALAQVVIGRREALARQDGQTAGLGTEPAGQSPDDAAMYIYLNDGRRLKAFLMSQVAHVSYSCTGLDGLTYDMPVVQLVQTRDSLYRIPIAAIDSICYQTPEPIMKKGIFIIDETNVGNIASVDFDNYTITFKSSTPAAQRPKQGQVVYSDLEEDPLPMGFSGRVTKISGDVYTWESAGPEEVFDRLLVVGRIEPGGNHSYSTRRFMSRRREHAEPSYKIKCDLLKPLVIDGKGQIIVDYTIDLNVFNSEPTLVDIIWQHDLEFGINVELLNEDNMQGAIPSAWDPNEKLKEIWTPPALLFTVWGIEVYGMVGAYISYGGEFSIELSGLKYKYSNKEHYRYNSEADPKWSREEIFHEKGWNFDDLADNIKLKTELAGKVSFGACVEFDVAVWKPKWASLGFNIKCGPELKGSISLDTDILKTMADEGIEAAMYKEFSENVKLTFGIKLGLDILARLGYKEWKLANISTTLYPATVTLLPKLSKPALPKLYRVGESNYFMETAYLWDHVDAMNVKTKATNTTLFPGPIGLSIYDANGKELYNQFTKDYDYWHWVKASTYQTSLSQYSPQTLKVYPQYKLFGFFPLKGEPSEITIPKPLTLSTNRVVVEEGKTADVTCNDGWDCLTIEAADKDAVSVSIKKRTDGSRHAKILGLVAGVTTVTVKDVRSGVTQTIDVTVRPTPIQLSANHLKLKVGQAKVITISPKAAYTLESSAPDVATALIDLTAGGSNRLKTVLQVMALKEGTATITITNPKLCRMTTLEVEVVDPNVINMEAEAVDLGLPSGVQWATCNVGAAFPEDCGGYYAWGETKDKTSYSWSNYQHCDGTSESAYDMGESIGLSQYDVANVQWGGMWRMPTDTEFRELLGYCTSEWMQVNGQWGREFTGPNGNSIFLPAAGYHEDKECVDESEEGCYWSESYSTYSWGTKYYLACCMKFDSDGTHRYGGSRYQGYSVRPVKSASPDDYVHGICGEPTPAEGAVTWSTGANFYVPITMPHNGSFVGSIIVSDKPDVSRKVKGVNISGNGRYGETYSWFSTSITGLQPNTKYYWRVKYFDFEKEDFVNCSPIWWFQTGSE